MKPIKKESGFTLIEVVASIVIITIVLLSFSQLFIQSNKTATHNNEKLVTINLADAALTKLKSTSFPKDPTIININDYFVDDVELEINMNNKKYSITYAASQSDKTDDTKNSNYTEKGLDLIKVVVTVTAPDGKIKGSSEGYVSLE